MSVRPFLCLDMTHPDASRSRLLSHCRYEAEARQAHLQFEGLDNPASNPHSSRTSPSSIRPAAPSILRRHSLPAVPRHDERLARHAAHQLSVVVTRDLRPTSPLDWLPSGWGRPRCGCSRRPATHVVKSSAFKVRPGAGSRNRPDSCWAAGHPSRTGLRGWDIHVAASGRGRTGLPLGTSPAD